MSENQIPPILVAVDFSEQSRTAFNAAVRLSEDMGTPLIVVHAYPQMKTPSLMMGDLEKKVIDEAKAEISKEEAMTLAEDWIQGARETGLEITSVATEGPPVDVILEAAKSHKVGMIIVGTHGRTGLKHLILGSVAEELVKRSDRPVLVVPTKKK